MKLTIQKDSITSQTHTWARPSIRPCDMNTYTLTRYGRLYRFDTKNSVRHSADSYMEAGRWVVRYLGRHLINCRTYGIDSKMANKTKQQTKHKNTQRVCVCSVKPNGPNKRVAVSNCKYSIWQRIDDRKMGEEELEGGN